MIRWIRNRLKSILLLVNYLVSFCFLVSLFSYLIPPSFSVIPSFFSLAYVYLFFINVFFLLFWVVKRQRFVYISLFPLVIGAKHFMNFFAFSSGDVTADHAFSIMSFNARYFNAPFYKDENKLQEQFNASLDLIVEKQPDILCAQEFSGKYKRHNQIVDKRLRSLGLSHKYRAGKSSLAIFSKYPIIDKEVLSFDDSYNGAIKALVVVDRDTLAIYSVHLQSIRLGHDEGALLDQENIQRLNQRETRQTYLRILSKLSNAFKRREEQVRMIKDHMDRSPYPVFVCVDMNDLPTSYAYFKLKGKLEDTFHSAGLGIGSTYAGKLPFLRIDFCFYEKGYQAIWYERGKTTNSDHYPIYIRFNKL